MQVEPAFKLLDGHCTNCNAATLPPYILLNNMGIFGRLLAGLLAALLTLNFISASGSQGSKGKITPTSKVIEKHAPMAADSAPKTFEYSDKYPDFDVPDAFPAPLALPDGAPDEAAWALAKKVLDGGPDCLAALERAALESGMSVHDENGKYKYLPD